MVEMGVCRQKKGSISLIRFNPIKPLNSSQWRKLYNFTKPIKGKEVQFMYKQKYIKTTEQNNLILRDTRLLNDYLDKITIGVECYNYIDDVRQ